jgi:DHA2 family multidrug resistance protein-like MFS transporter
VWHTLIRGDAVKEIATPGHPRRWWAFACLCLPVLVTSMDVSVLLFAVPSLTRDLHAGASQQLWILDVYGLVLAALLLPFGALADRIGRRRLLLLGAALFGLASLAAAEAPTAGWLIAARAVLGLGGATLLPSALALVRSLFDDPAERSKAVGIWSAVLAGGVGLGPVVSGLLIEHYWWGSVFLVNLPAVALLLIAVPALVPESRALESAPLDLLGAAFCLVAVLSLVYAVQTVAESGWSATRAGAVAMGLLAGALFVARQRRSAHPMIDPTWFTRPVFAGSVGVNAIGMAVVVGNGFLISQYLQSVLGMSPLRAALWSLAPTVVVGGVAPLAAVAARRLGRSATVAGALAVAAAGFLVLTRAQPHSSLWLALIGATLVACGVVSVATLVTDVVVSAVPPHQTGAAAGFVETTTELAGALGIAVLGSVLAAVYRGGVHDVLPALPREARAAASQSLAGALAVAQEGGGRTTSVVAAARAAYTTGMHSADVVAACLLSAGAVIALVTLRDRGRAAEPTSGADPVPADQPA